MACTPARGRRGRSSRRAGDVQLECRPGWDGVPLRAYHYGVHRLIGFANSAPRFFTSNGADCGGSLKTGGKMEGRAIDTLGYRGMHSYEVAFDGWFVPDDCLIGGEAGLGRGFYYQMEGFENGRLQTAARAVGVMQAAYEAAAQYARGSLVFGRPVGEYQLTQAKLARMAVVIQAARQFAYTVARMMAKGEGALEASMVKAYVCRAAEWVTREAMQIHGGYGYAEEYTVSRLFVDAAGALDLRGRRRDPGLKVIARRLLEQAGASRPGREARPRP